ncbi:hypothetical protein [Tichowtungia aerotolerans]|uniref:Uncharacterized protein n=1 Tax=Tichowtungia aerotolerans TaxID=2697043 RepID=A0A6P1MF73_9BACT|nr:hypothetical protein [Tichowtungia aerotolerans]QHI69715.1 hypothetical protein GT409_09705 [Tichowtungia aerotolerans]
MDVLEGVLEDLVMPERITDSFANRNDEDNFMANSIGDKLRSSSSIFNVFIADEIDP